MSEPIISVSGLRGIVGDSLTPLVAIRYACAFAGELRGGPVLLGRDGRSTGRIFLDAISAALRGTGHNVIDADLTATPTVGVLVRARHAAGGIQISASHNPPEYNGLKLFDPKGSVLTAHVGRQVLERYHANQQPWVAHDRTGHVEVCSDSVSDHLKLVLDTVDVERIRSRRFRVLLDSNHGAGSLLGRHLLESLGCQAIFVGAQADGHFEHPPEPLLENLGAISKRVAQEKVDVGFCQDPDADRLAVINEKGEFLGEEYTLALCLDHVLRQRPGPVVTNCATSKMCEDIASRYAVPFYRSAVGEANVVQEMRANDAVFGGEGNGGPIDPRVVFVRDSFVGMAQILDAMAARKQPVSELAAELPRYEIFKRKVAMPPERVSRAFDALESHFKTAVPSRLDGLRLDWPDHWLLIRGSNTEPIVRVIAEAQSEELAIRRSLEAIKVLATVR